jgi:hypothetical protein
VYGDSYPRAELYRPEELVRRNQAGEWLSAVALAANGTVVGHTALERSPLAPIAEFAGGLVLVEHRGHGLVERMRDLLVEDAIRLGLAGLVTDVALTSTAAQRVANRSPARPCGLTLGLWPAAGPPMPPDAGRARRLDFVQYFRYLRPPERVVVQILARHQDIVGRTYAQFGLPCEFRCDRLPQQDGHMTVHAHTACQHVFIRVQQVGTTIPAQLDQARRDFWNNAQLEAA